MGNSIINCRSILNILSKSVRQGDEVELRCTGDTEEEDLKFMEQVIADELER